MRTGFVLVSLALMLLGCRDEGVPPAHHEPKQEIIRWNVLKTYPDIRFDGLGKLVHFDPSGKFGYAIGRDFIDRYKDRCLVTRDGGKTWPEDFECKLRGMVFLDSTTGYRTHTPFYKTTDGGQTVTPMSIPVDGSLRPISANTLILFPSDDRRSLLKSDDGGFSWQRIALPKERFWVDSFDGRNIIVIGKSDEGLRYGKHILYSSDGGATWTLANIDTTEFTRSSVDWQLSRVQFSNSTHAHAVVTVMLEDALELYKKRRVVLLRTIDSGRTWHKAHETEVTARYGDRYSMGITTHFPLAKSPQWIWNVVYDDRRESTKSYVSNDDGRMWEYAGEFGLGPPYQLYIPTFAPPNWKIGISGNLMTFDGGKTWTKMPWYVRAAAFIGPTEVIAVRDSLILKGTILR